MVEVSDSPEQARTSTREVAVVEASGAGVAGESVAHKDGIEPSGSRVNEGTDVEGDRLVSTGEHEEAASIPAVGTPVVSNAGDLPIDSGASEPGTLALAGAYSARAQPASTSATPNADLTVSTSNVDATQSEQECEGGSGDASPLPEILPDPASTAALDTPIPEKVT